MLECSKDETLQLVGMEFPNLRPGFAYVLRVRGLNVTGPGPWSNPSLSVNTHPTIPATPSPPFLASSSLRSLVLQWNPPHDDGGTAITGYRLHLLNTDKTLELPRSTMTYTWTGLFPGGAPIVCGC